MPLIIPAVPPFDFGLSASIFGEGDSDIRSCRGGIFRQAVRVEDRLVLLTVTPVGTVDSPEVRVTIRPGPVPPKVSNGAGKMVTLLFNLDLDLTPFERAVREDPVMSGIVRRLRGLKPPRTATLFEALVDSITEQQISLIAAHSMERKLIRTFGDRLTVDGQTYYAFPTPENLASASPDELRACGLSGRKAEYISGIARQVKDGTLELGRFGPGEETDGVIRELTAIRGVGTWTAELAALRGLARLDAIPADDLGIRRAISRFYSGGTRIDTREARRIAEAWGPWRGLAAFYLIIAERKGMIPGKPGIQYP